MDVEYINKVFDEEKDKIVNTGIVMEPFGEPLHRNDKAYLLKNELNRFIVLNLLDEVEDETESTDTIIFRVLNKYLELK